VTATNDVSLRVRPELAGLTPYRWQEGVPDGPVFRLDMNTPPDPPAWLGPELARVMATSVNAYPDATYDDLRVSIGRFVGLPGEQVVVGAGCDEILAVAAQLALARGDRACLAAPTYSLYRLLTRNAGAALTVVPPLSGSLRLDLEGLLTAAAGSRVVWACSPNNPTGEELSSTFVAELCAACPGIVVVDQAYVELGGVDLSGLVAEHDNLVIARTFSKGWQLAGLRIGYALASPVLANLLDAVRPPASLASWSVAVARLACENVASMRAACSEVVAARGELAAGMRRAGVEVDAEAANFVLAQAPCADLFAALARRGVVVRTFPSEPSLVDRFRVTVGTPEAHEVLLHALAEVAGGEAPPSRPAPGLRRATIRRSTRETEIDCIVDLDGRGRASIATGIGFLDHLLTALTFWSMLDLDLRCRGDLWIDEHHTVEDCAIALGEALDQALGDRAGLVRFSDASAPLDEALARATVDLSGRGMARISLGLRGQRVGQISTSLIPHFLDTLARRSRIGLHVACDGDDDHHQAEAAFKALALALRGAVARDPQRQGAAPSTKGVL
jgi:histidinol-phosphate aminotransferase